MSDRENGFYGKYRVERIDGKPITKGCVVMEFKDPNGRAGIKAFSKAVRADGYDILANDLDDILSGYDDTRPHCVVCKEYFHPEMCAENGCWDDTRGGPWQCSSKCKYHIDYEGSKK